MQELFQVAVCDDAGQVHLVSEPDQDWGSAIKSAQCVQNVLGQNGRAAIVALRLVPFVLQYALPDAPGEDPPLADAERGTVCGEPWPEDPSVKGVEARGEPPDYRMHLGHLNWLLEQRWGANVNLPEHVARLIEDVEEQAAPAPEGVWPPAAAATVVPVEAAG